MRWISAWIALTGLCLASSSYLSQPALAGDGLGCNLGCSNSCNNGCCDCGGLVTDVELTFMKYMQEGGVTDITGSPAGFDLDLAPRFELGYMGSNDIGVRSRYWYYDSNTTSAAGNPLGVNAYTIDGELFHERCLGRKTHLEVSLGLRYLDFKQDIQDLGVPVGINSEFEGWGGTFAVEAEHPFWIGNAYARGRWSILLGNADAINVNGGGTTAFRAEDTTSTLTELGIGYELSRCFGNWGTGSIRFGGEWQTWSNVALADTAFGGLGNDDVLEDAGFAGLVLGMEWKR